MTVIILNVLIWLFTISALIVGSLHLVVYWAPLKKGDNRKDYYNKLQSQAEKKYEIWKNRTFPIDRVTENLEGVR